MKLLGGLQLLVLCGVNEAWQQKVKKDMEQGLIY